MSQYVQMEDAPPSSSRKMSSASTGGPQVHNALGTFNGCFIPCCLNILGIILFQRLAWAIGQAGISGVLLIFLLAESMAILTVLSFSAIVTNGSMRGGGSYFMISRSLGPEFGGAIGLLFYLAYAVGVAFYISGFSLAVRSSFFEDAPVYSTNLYIGTIGLAAVAVISYIGAGVFAKFNIIFFVIQMAAIVSGIFSILITSGHINDIDMTDTCNDNFPYHHGSSLWDICLENGTKISHPKYSASTTSSSWSNVKSNWGMHFDYAMDTVACDGTTCDFHSVFAIVFPAATGIMEGANLSGDLKDPSRSIPRGTLFAVGFAILTYSVLTLSMGASYPRDTLRFDMDAYQDATFGMGYPLLVGILVSSLSSALGSLFGGARVLQALARDKLFPWPLSYIEVFAKGSRIGDEPQRAVVVTWVIAQCCLFIGSIDAIAPIQTGFFCLSYALCNLTCFVLKITGAPNFRPQFTFFSWHSALLGFLLNMGVMFWLNYISATVSTLALIAVFGIILFKGPRKDWGDVSQALMWHQVRKYLLRLEADTHAKFWRPSYLLFANDIGKHQLIEFCERSKKGGLFLIGHVMIGDVFKLAKPCHDLRKKWLKQIRGSSVKAIPKVIISPSTRLGYQFLMTGGGVGGLDINTIVLPLQHRAPARSFVRGDEDSMESKTASPRNSGAKRDHLKTHIGAIHADLNDEIEYIATVQDALRLERNVILCSNFKDLASSKQNEKGSFVDVWLDVERFLSRRKVSASVTAETTAAFMTHVAFILSENQRFCKDAKLRVFRVLPEVMRHEASSVEDVMIEALNNFRISAEVRCVMVPENAVDSENNFAKMIGKDNNRLSAMSEVMRRESTNTCQTFVAISSKTLLETPAEKLQQEGFVDRLKTLSFKMPPVAFCAKGERGDVIYEFI